MIVDNHTDQYLSDENGDNCFDFYKDALIILNNALELS
jgi:hypothetical protein